MVFIDVCAIIKEVKNEKSWESFVGVVWLLEVFKDTLNVHFFDAEAD